MVLLSALIVLSGFGIVGIHFSYALSVAKDVGTNADSHTGFEISGVDSPADTFLASSFPYDSISATSGADQTFTQEEVSTGSDASLDPPDVQSPELSSQDTASGSSTTEYMKPGLVITSKHCSLLSGRSQWAKRAQKGVCECMSPSEVCPSEQRTPVCCYGNFRNPNYIDTCIQSVIMTYATIRDGSFAADLSFFIEDTRERNVMGVEEVANAPILYKISGKLVYALYRGAPN